MANWTGTYTITTPGTTPTAVNSTTLTNTGASWPTGANSLSNFIIRILTGPGAGTDTVIVSNTATVITVTAWTGTQPTTGSTYEIVLKLFDQDHFTANTNFSTNIKTELADSATILFDGTFTLQLLNSCTVRWNKSESTLATFCANSRTTQGKAGFWTNILVDTTLSITPNISYVRLQDSNSIQLRPSTALGDCSTIHHIWGDSNISVVTYYDAAAVTNSKVKYCLARGGAFPSTSFIFSGIASSFSQMFEWIWVERSGGGGVSWNNSGATGSALEWVANSVFLNPTSANRNTASGQTHRWTNNYSGSLSGQGQIYTVFNMSATTDAGTHAAYCNITVSPGFVSSTNFAGTSNVLELIGNDLRGGSQASTLAINTAAFGNYVTATSDMDYIAGNNLAAPENVDTTTGTLASGYYSSSASPQQWRFLSAARTNVKSTPNFPAALNNIVLGTPTASGISISYDCQNGATGGFSTTVATTSNSGQAVLNVTSASSMRAGMELEIGYGTARSETGRILSISTNAITLESNLTFTHTSGQADVVAVAQRNYGLPFIKYGTTSGVYDMQTAIPSCDSFGFLWTGIRTTVNGKVFTWKRTGHSVSLTNLKPNTTYYCRCFVLTPLNELIDQGSESSFTTGASTTIGHGYVG